MDALVDRFAPRAATEPELVARHAEAAGRTDDAIVYLERGGDRAQARSAHEEAIVHMRKALALLETRPAGAERDARELTLQLALAASLIAVRGHSHAETETAYERAAALAHSAGDPVRLGIARTGLAIVYFTRGKVERGRALAVEVLEAAEGRDDREQALIGHTNAAIPEFYQGKFASSLAHCERAVALYDPVQHHGFVRVLGNDQGIVALDFAAWALWFLGRPDAAVVRAREAVALARRLAHPFNLASAVFWETILHWFRRDGAAQGERAAELIALSEPQGFPFWLGLGRALRAAAHVTEGDSGMLAEISEGLVLASETRTRSGAPALFLLLAEAQHAAGLLADSRGTVATGLAIAARTGQPAFDADLHRLDGDLLLATGSSDDEAAARYRHALALAREQGARSLELRATARLARLLGDQDRAVEGYKLLAPIYASFTEGFDTVDLIEAKTLLDELR